MRHTSAIGTVLALSWLVVGCVGGSLDAGEVDSSAGDSATTTEAVPDGGVDPTSACSCACDNGRAGYRPQCAPGAAADAAPTMPYCSSGSNPCIALDVCCYCECTNGAMGYRPQCGGGWDYDGAWTGVPGAPFCNGGDPCVTLDTCSFPADGGAPRCQENACGL